ncbi:recombinase family protein [Streptomonospora arabica]|uniref:Recombinase family protein n=1 Tax=Streptomonospora arabica TaxID=412417 RepID=A0ABV9STX9_9ACTN
MEFQDRDSSRGWQREAAEEVIADYGGIVAEFFDAGCSRQVAWEQRPQAAALPAAAAQSGRPFDAVVVGEYERAFAGGQFEEVVAKLAGCGVRVWLPEAGGLVDLSDPEHAVLMRVLGAQSQREVLRCRYRVLAAILANPRYTGRQVWQRSGARSPDSGAGRPGREEWAVSKEAAHPALVSEGEFVAAQAVRKARPTKDGSAREYVFAGLLVCGVCGRRMDAHWLNGRAGYRCRHAYSSSRPRGVIRKKSLYLREDRLLEAIALGLPGRDSLGIARYLRANELAVVCDTATWEVVGAEHAKGPSQSDLVEAPEPGQYPLMGKWFVSEGGLEPPCP